jgi:hypothetical protein
MAFQSLLEPKGKKKKNEIKSVRKRMNFTCHALPLYITDSMVYLKYDFPKRVRG